MQMYTLGYENRTFSCPPTGVSVAEHNDRAAEARKVTAGPIPVLPTLPAWGTGLENSLS